MIPDPSSLFVYGSGVNVEPVTRTRRSSSASYIACDTSSVPDGSRIVFGLAFS